MNSKLQVSNFKLRIKISLFFLLIPTIVYAKSAPFGNFDHPRLVETGELATVIDHPSVRIVDMRTSLSDYLKGHILNAVHLHFETLRVPRNGIPAQTPDRIFLEKMIGGYLSVSNDMWVILYSEKSDPNATYLLWILDYLGHKRVGILNGGWEKWAMEKHPVSQSYPFLLAKKFFGRVNRETLVEKKWVQNQLSAKKDVVIVDGRPPKQYSGEEGEEIRRGHIPGAVNISWEATLEGDEIRTWKKKEDLEKLFAEYGITKDKQIIVYCRTGMEASHLYFTLQYVLGFPNVHLYKGSWVEWSADKSLPIKMGTDP